MTGLLLNDLYSMKRLGKTYALFLLFFIILGVVSGNSSFFGSFIAVYSMMIGISVFSFHEQSHWDSYANTLPVSREGMAGSYYLIAGIAILTGAVLGFLVQLGTVVSGEMTVPEALIVTAILAAVGLWMMAFDIPLFLKFGSERGRMVMIGTYIVMFGALFAVSRLTDVGTSLAFLTEQNIGILAAAALGSGLIVLFVSYRISQGIYRKKEF